MCDLNQVLPGEPLISGFSNWRPASELQLTNEAQARVLAKMDDVKDALMRANASSRTSVVG